MEERRQIVIGLTGPFGSGCTKVADYLRDVKGWRRYSMRDAMCEIAPAYIHPAKKSQKPPIDRRHLQDIGDNIRKTKYFAAIAEKVASKIEDDEKVNFSLQSESIVIDGIRNHNEIVYLRDKYPHFFVVAIFASFDTRWNRKRKDKDYKHNQAKFERDDIRDSGELEPMWGQKVQLCVDRSDVIIGNDRDFTEPGIEEEFWSRFNGYIQLMEKPGSVQPTIQELNMSLAYQMSLMSTCCRRKVGATIVREEIGPPTRSYVISSGHNEVPIHLRTCAQRGGSNQKGYCVRDEAAKKVFRDRYKTCPKCGTKIDNKGEYPYRCPKCESRLPHDFIPGRMLDLCPSLHAEEDAILQAAKLGSTEIEGSVLYTTTFPCPLCAKKIVQVGIDKVYFAEPYPENEAISILAEAGIESRLFVGVKGRAYHRLFEQQLVD
ncbi:MAG: deaminase [Dehalococcoidia bacterium]